jgi:hypothetical protein
VTVIINLFAGPGAGKSTTKAGLFFEMKQRGLKVEVVEEYAKELTYEGDFGTLSNSVLVLAEQDRRQRRLVGKVDYVITDSPLLINSFYVKGYYANDFYRAHVSWLFDNYENFNVWVDRVKPYANYGRSQTEEEARAICSRMKSTLADKMHLTVPGDREAPLSILKALKLY